MLRGGKSARARRQLRDKIAAAIAAEGVLARLARRIAFQLVVKFDVTDLEDAAVWHAIGARLRDETDQLRTHLGLVDRQIVVALPKLSADQIEAFLQELEDADPNIARTILNAALDAAQPLSTGRRYLAEYHRVADQLGPIDSGIARTLANATFMARAPSRKAMDHFKHFADLLVKFHDDVDYVRTLARAACRAPDPLKAARGFTADYDAIVAELTSKGIEPQIAHTLAGIASLTTDPIPSAYKLLEHFEEVLRLTKLTHPSVARTIALSACRAADPLSAARSYMKNYDTIVRRISRIDPHRAREVANPAFRSDNPLRWATRYREELQRTRQRPPLR